MKPTILLVDDEEVSNFLNRRLIELVGVEANIDSANNGEQALNIINHHFESGALLPDFIFLDINMPVMDGFEFMTNFNLLQFAGKDKVKIIFTSSSTSLEDVARAKELGARGFITKPLNQDFLHSFFNSFETGSLPLFISN